MKKAAVIILVTFSIIALIVWAIPLAPEKELVVIAMELPRMDGSEGTSPAYLIYYVWDGEQEKHPWWMIHEAPLENGSFEWAVLEVADVGNVYDTDQFTRAMTKAQVFDKNWFRKKVHRVQRTRWEKIRHIVFGTDNFYKEEKAIQQVLSLIQSDKKEP